MKRMTLASLVRQQIKKTNSVKLLQITIDKN